MPTARITGAMRSISSTFNKKEYTTKRSYANRFNTLYVKNRRGIGTHKLRAESFKKHDSPGIQERRDAPCVRIVAHEPNCFIRGGAGGSCMRYSPERKEAVLKNDAAAQPIKQATGPYQGSYSFERRKRSPLVGFCVFEGPISETPVIYL